MHTKHCYTELPACCTLTHLLLEVDVVIHHQLSIKLRFLVQQLEIIRKNDSHPANTGER